MKRFKHGLKTAEERGKLLFKWHQLIEEHTDELAEIMTVEQGKPLKEAKVKLAMPTDLFHGTQKKANAFTEKQFQLLLLINDYLLISSLWESWQLLHLGTSRQL